MESPGTAPGSEPRITGAFIAIFPVARNRFNIGTGQVLCKREAGAVSPAFLAWFIGAIGAGRAADLSASMKPTRQCNQRLKENYAPTENQTPQHQIKRPARNPARAVSNPGKPGQKPALISSNSSIILSRKA